MANTVGSLFLSTDLDDLYDKVSYVSKFETGTVLGTLLIDEISTDIIAPPQTVSQILSGGNCIEINDNKIDLQIDNTIDLESSRPVENQTAAHEFRQLRYEVMIAQEGVRQVARRVKVLEDETEKSTPIGYDLGIETVEQLIAFANNVNSGAEDYNGKKVALLRNLDMSGVSIDQFKGIGSYAHPFVGTFDGMNHCIMDLNLTVKNSDAQNNYFGLFPCVGTAKQTDYVEIKNLHMINCSLKTDESNANAVKIGGLIGNLFGLHWIIENCTYSGTVDGMNNFGGLVAQMCGFNDATRICKMTNCAFTGFIHGRGTSAHRVVGGLVGKIVTSDGNNWDVCYPIIENCKMNGLVSTVKTADTWPIVAGIVASSNNCPTLKISNCYSNALILIDDKTFAYSPILNAINSATQEQVDAMYEMLAANTWNKDIYKDDTYKLYNFNGVEYTMS